MLSQNFKNGTTIFYSRELNGGGATQYLDFLQVIESSNKKYSNGLEWCSGLGAIGFSILDSGYCDNMTFMDSYPPCEQYTIKSAEHNNLSNRVKFFNLDKIQNIPLTEKYDLIVANPPHCVSEWENIHNNPHAYRWTLDKDWKIHNEFFSSIRKYCISGADIYLSEISEWKDHKKMAGDNGLIFVNSYSAPELSKTSSPKAVIMHYKI